MDPREALLALNKAAEDEPLWVNPAYKKTNPNPQFNKDVTHIDKLKFFESQGEKACKHCGLKFCTCSKKK